MNLAIGMSFSSNIWQQVDEDILEWCIVYIVTIREYCCITWMTDKWKYGFMTAYWIEIYCMILQKQNVCESLHHIFSERVTFFRSHLTKLVMFFFQICLCQAFVFGKNAHIWWKRCMGKIRVNTSSIAGFNLRRNPNFPCINAMKQD